MKQNIDELKKENEKLRYKNQTQKDDLEKMEKKLIHEITKSKQLNII